MDDFLYLWPIYGSALQKIEPDPNKNLTRRLGKTGNIAVLGADHYEARRALITSLRICAKRSYDTLTSGQAQHPSDGWLVVDIPIPSRVEPHQLLHHIMQPSSKIEDKFASWAIETGDGRTLVGLLVSRNDVELLLKDANGRQIDIALPVQLACTGDDVVIPSISKVVY